MSGTGLIANMVYLIIQILILLFVPYLLTLLTKRMGTENWLSPVVCCYIVGIGLRNLTPFPLHQQTSSFFSQGTIILAIPLLLYSTDFLGWLKLAKSTILSFVLMVISVIAGAVVTAWLFKGLVLNVSSLVGMLSGVYIGGTPNLNAVGIALGVNDEMIVTLNAAEIACGGIYLLFLTSVAHWFFGLFLPDFQGDKHAGVDEFLPQTSINRTELLMAIGLTLLLVAVSAGLVKILTGKTENPGLIILLISALSVAASFFPKIRNLRGSYELGEYLLLLFSIAIDMMADFSDNFTSGGRMIALAATVLLIAVVLHVILCSIFRIDRDTMIITSTAGIYGPPFIGQVAAVIKNRSLVFSGIATGLVGIAVANFIGVLLANILDRWL